MIHYLLPLTLLAGPFQGPGQPYTISGEIRGLNNDSVILFIQEKDKDGGFTRLDTIVGKAQHNLFHMQGNIAGPRTASLRLGGMRSHKAITLFVEKGAIRIKGDLDSTDDIKISGTVNNDLYMAENGKENKIYGRIRDLQQAKAPSAAIDGLRDSINASRIRFVEKHPNAMASGIYLYVLCDRMPLAQIEHLYNIAGDNVKGSGYGVIVRNSIEGKKRAAIGQTAPDFTSTDTSGKAVSLSSFRGKYVLLDFWASWCVPCRAESPYLLAAFKKYRDKGFTIVSISMDNDAAKWKAAIRQDGLDWTHLSDLKAFENPVAKLYGVQPIPDNFLIDPDGKIIAHALRGDEVDKTLSALLGSGPAAGPASQPAAPGSAMQSAKQSAPDSLYALGVTYYKARDRKCVDYFIKAYMAGDTSKQMFRMLSVAEKGNWDLDVPRTANTLDSLKHIIEDHPDSLLPLQQFIFVLGDDNDTVVTQLEAWMKQFPKSPAIPYALGESYYDKESPKATPYLLKVAALQPKNAKVWYMLEIDAKRWGNNDKAREYIGRAAAAAPDDPEYAFSYAAAFQDKDSLMFRKLLLEIPEKFPGNDKGAEALSWLAYCTRDREEKINLYERLRKLYPPAKNEVSEANMNRLFDLYLQEGLTDKAIELATSMGEAEGFSEKLQLAKDLAAVRDLVKEKRYKEAQDGLSRLKLSRYSTAVNTVALLKAEVRDAAGSTQMAYDSLLLIEAKTPDDDIREAIAIYGTKLGRSPEETEKDIWALRDKFTTPAPPFELGLYTSSGKAKLEDYRGKLILLTFWFPGCGPCRGEMPHFQKIVNKYDKKDLAYIGINVSPGQDDYVLPFMRGTKYSFIPLRGNGEWAKQVYHVRGEPTNFLIDKEGKIVYSDFMINGDNEHMLELMINSMLAKK